MIEIHKEVYGQGQPMVLIHGWAMHSGIWRGFAQQLAKNYQVICLDLPGHGLSEAVEPYDLQAIAAALVDAMPESPCCVLGWSLGATVALALAAHYPQRINSLILLAGNPRFVEDNDWAGMKAELLEDFSNNLLLNCQQTLIRFLALQVNQLQNGKHILKDLKLAVKECDPPTEQVLQSALLILKQADLRQAMLTLACPLTVILGEKDTLVPVQLGQDMKQLKPDLQLAVIERAGHVPFLSHQSQLIDIIKQSV